MLLNKSVAEALFDQVDAVSRITSAGQSRAVTSSDGRH